MLALLLKERNLVEHFLNKLCVEILDVEAEERQLIYHVRIHNGIFVVCKHVQNFLEHLRAFVYERDSIFKLGLYSSGKDAFKVRVWN